MKKAIVIFAIAASVLAVASCKNCGKKAAAEAEVAVVCDSTKACCDSCAAACDSTKACCDSCTACPKAE